MKNKYPIYVISKGCWSNPLTVKYLQWMDTEFNLVIEPQEYDKYLKIVKNKNCILRLPFSNLGQGSIPARNWVWEHALKRGVKRHWILDDNIRGFYRLYKGERRLIKHAIVFRIIEDFSDRFSNVALSGMQYKTFCPDGGFRQPPLELNTRIYSCILINNSIPYRWRGRYNEDTDLSLRALKDGWCTILFKSFLCDKIATMSMRGGNTDQLYKGDGRLKMAESLLQQHPDCVKIIERWGRAQHLVDYSGFRGNQLKPVIDYSSLPEINNYGLVLKERRECDSP